MPYLETADLMITTGYGDDFLAAARRAVREMAERLIAAHNLTWEEAGMLLSAAGDLRICQSYGGQEIIVRLEFPKLPRTGSKDDRQERQASIRRPIGLEGNRQRPRWGVVLFTGAWGAARPTPVQR